MIPPVDDEPFVLAMPLNPNIRGRLHKPEQDTLSQADHLATRAEQERGGTRPPQTGQSFYRNYPDDE